MAKRFKLRISRVIQSCRSKDPSTLPNDPVPSFLRPSPPVNPNPNLILDVDFPPFPHRSSFKRHVSSSFTSVGCGFRSKPSSRYATVNGFTESTDFKWQKEEKWHVVAKVHDDTPRRKIYNTSASENDDVLPPPTSVKTKRRTSKKKTTYKHRNSTSSAESGLFSSEGGDERENDEEEEEEEERETLFSSSRSFSTDSSSEYNPQLQTITETPISMLQNKKKKKKKNRGNRAKRSVSIFFNSPEIGSPARLSVFQKLIPCAVEGKVRESFAIVKKSEDPYEDFKRSMMDMILEKHMFEERDLEKLLQCFLSLNSINHHGVIVEAFSEIWDALFCRTSSIQ